jgi:Uma2 family endonuclease
LHSELRLSPAQFALLCKANADAVLDLSATGQLIQITPAGGDTPAHATPCCFTPCSTTPARMAAYRANGAQLGWLLIPDQQAVEVYAPPTAPPLPLNASSFLLSSRPIPWCLACTWSWLNSGRLEEAGLQGIR